MLLILVGGGALVVAAILLARRRSAAAAWWGSAAMLHADGRRLLGQLASRLDADPVRAAAGFAALESTRTALGGRLDDLATTAPDDGGRGAVARVRDALDGLGSALDDEAAALRGATAATPDQVAFMRATTDQRSGALGAALDALVPAQPAAPGSMTA